MPINCAKKNSKNEKFKIFLNNERMIWINKAHVFIHSSILYIHTLLLFNLQSREKASSRSGFIRIYTVPMVSSPRDPRSLSILCCTGPYDSSMWTSTRIHNDMRTTLPRRRATGASRRREHGPYFTQISAGVLRRSDGVKEKKDRFMNALSTRFYIDHRL